MRDPIAVRRRRSTVLRRNNHSRLSRIRQIQLFAVAHTAGPDRPRAQEGPVNWLAHPARTAGLPRGRTGRYRIGGEGVPEPPSAHLSYADLAVALVDEAEKPTLHRTRVSVFN